MSRTVSFYGGSRSDTAWEWLSTAMAAVKGWPLWAAYLPKRPVRKRTGVVDFVPAPVVERATGIEWDRLINFLELQVNTEECHRAQVVVILSDNRQPENIPHWGTPLESWWKGPDS